MSFAPHYPRDLRGYGRNPVQADWPGGARIAVQFVLNCEEGGENCVLHGDPTSEQFLSEIVGADAYPARHMSMESIYEYGSRAGVWRILREFERRELPLTLFDIGMALERNPEVAHACIELGHEIACHGWRWIHYQALPPELEAEHIRLCVAALERLSGTRPLGWYTGRDSPNTRRLVAEHGGFLYNSDYYGDDLPFWTEVELSSGHYKGIRPRVLATNYRSRPFLDMQQLPVRRRHRSLGRSFRGRWQFIALLFSTTGDSHPPDMWPSKYRLRGATVQEIN